MISAIWHNSKFNFELEKKVKIQFRFFLNKIFMFPCCTLEDLSIDVSINKCTDIDEAKVISALCQKSKFNFKL